MKNQKGITLIALVITIIVLLILAGVSISMVIGNNGILNQASTAAQNSQNASEREQVQLAYLAAKTNKMANNDYTAVTKAELETALAKNGVTGVTVSEDGGKIVVDYGNGKTYDVENEIVTPNNKPDSGDNGSGNTGVSLASQIDASNYGDYVNYSKDLGLTLSLDGESTTPTTDWRIFYEDTEQDRVYLIASDYVPNTSSLLKASSAGMTANGDYSLYWSSAPSTLSAISRQDSIFGINASSYVLNVSNSNSTCVSNLLDTDHWSNFVDTTVADYAIGGPTIEMYANSWNGKGYRTITPTSESTATGYKVNGANYVNMSSDTGYGDNLYYTHRIFVGIGSEDCEGYWLASPSADYANDVVYVGCSGGVNNRKYSYSNVSVRPVVSLNSGITATKDANGVWQLGE